MSNLQCTNIQHSCVFSLFLFLGYSCKKVFGGKRKRIGGGEKDAARRGREEEKGR